MPYIGADAQGIIANIDGGTISNATLDSTVTFPAGTVIQTVTDQYAPSSAITVTSEDDYLGSNLQCTITPKANGNKLFIQVFVPSIYNNQIHESLNAGLAYDASFSSGNGTTIGPRSLIADTHNYVNQSEAVGTNLQFSIIVAVGTQAPSAGSASIIRPIFGASSSSVLIANNAGYGTGVFSMMVMEIQG